ncbi:MAG: hypothetical protein ABW104_18100 [Candidatus Thiodiazotropha sp. 6PLUC2]|nr:hypothetical protein [Candidatus Thiodiazotropha lotti]MCW4218792.1 hypothetical protein [Candidatus Thiodiazotropha lotti]
MSPMRMNLRSSLTAFLLCLLSTMVHAQWDVEGRLLQWKASAPSSWIGGNSSQIATVKGQLRSQGSSLIKLMDELWYKSRTVDAYLTSMDVSGVKTGIASRIVFDVANREFSSEYFTSETWEALASTPLDGYPQSSSTEFLGANAPSIGGKPSNCATFVTTMPSQRFAYDVLCFVHIGQGKTHMIKFRTDGSKWDEHLNELNSILGTLRYY